MNLSSQINWPGMAQGLIVGALVFTSRAQLSAAPQGGAATRHKYGAFPERANLLLTSQSVTGPSRWQMVQSEKVGAEGAQISQSGFAARNWQNAIVPGTVLKSLVADGVYPEPYFSLNNAHEANKIPDISQVGTGFWKTLPIRPHLMTVSSPSLSVLPEPVNLAKGKMATASSVEIPDRTPDKALDNNTETRWSSERTDDQWIVVDLDTPQRIGVVRLNWEAAYAKEYKIQISNEGQTWVDIAHITDNKGGIEVREFAPVTARYLRILGLKRATEYGYSLWEIGVYTPGTKLITTSQTPIDTSLPSWALGPFTRPAAANAQPVIAPNPASLFQDPVSQKPVKWEALHTFNPAAIVRNGKINVLYRAEDDSGEMAIGKHTSRLGLAVSEDGIHFTRRPAPVFFPANDTQKDNEWPGGCEDPRLVESEDGTYVLAYTQWNRQIFRVGIATSKDLEHWTKHGHAFEHALNGKYANLRYKSAGIVTRLKDGRLIAAKINGKYWMYWGEGTVHLATSSDLINWTPLEDAQGQLVNLIGPRRGKFDSAFPEVGPPPLLTDQGILLLYNGKNSGDNSDKSLGAEAYAAGQALFHAKDPSKLMGRLDTPFFKPEMSFEMRGQYRSGTTFIEGLVFFKGKWFLYYGCADSLVGVAVHDPKAKVVPQ